MVKTVKLVKTYNIVPLVILLWLALPICCSKDNCVEKKKESCVVTFELNPVCSCNGVTYENPSTAKCNSIDDYTMGARE